MPVGADEYAITLTEGSSRSGAAQVEPRPYEPQNQQENTFHALSLWAARQRKVLSDMESQTPSNDVNNNRTTSI